MITIATQCDDRKAMVRRLSEYLQTPAVYLYTPTYAFRIGEMMVNRDATVSGEREALLPAAACLLENGYITELPEELTEADSEAPMEKAPAQEAPAQAEPAEEAPEQETPVPTAPADTEDISVTTLRIYEPGWTVQSLTNFMHMLYARQDLINRMLQMNCLRIDEAFIQALASDSMTCVGDFEALLHRAITEGQVTGVNIGHDAVLVELPWEQDSIRWVFYSQLISACIKAAKTAKRVLPRRLDSEADKYHANAWLARLGFGGPEHKELRSTLMGHLGGYAAFKTADRMQAHKDKLAEQRRIRRESMEEEHKHD